MERRSHSSLHYDAISERKRTFLFRSPVCFSCSFLCTSENRPLGRETFRFQFPFFAEPASVLLQPGGSCVRFGFGCVLMTISPLQKPNAGLGMILDSAVGIFPHKIGPLLQLLTALLSDKPTAKKVQRSPRNRPLSSGTDPPLLGDRPLLLHCSLHALSLLLVTINVGLPGVQLSGQDVFLHRGVQAQAQRHRVPGGRDSVAETDTQAPLPPRYEALAH